MKAAQQEHSGSQTNLGNMYAQGLGTLQNMNDAVAWWQRAAELGHPMAMCNLGYAYGMGDGVRADQIMSAKWLMLGAQFGSQSAAEALAEQKADLSPEQIAEAERLAAEWKPKKAQ